MTGRSLFAFTPPDIQALPPYLNVSQQDDGSYSITVRGNAQTGEDGVSLTSPQAVIPNIPQAVLAELFLTIGEHLYSPEIMGIAGKVIMKHVMESAVVVDDSEPTATA